MFGHIIHLAVPARVKPCREARFGIREVRIADTHLAETQLASPCLDARRERSQRGFIGCIERM